MGPPVDGAVDDRQLDLAVHRTEGGGVCGDRQARDVAVGLWVGDGESPGGGGRGRVAVGGGELLA
jgi:hypothetical protein